MNVEQGAQPDITALLRSRGWPVQGVFVGGSVSRGIGSSFRAMAHTHTRPEHGFEGWICVRSAKRLLTASEQPTRILLHEVAHVLAPKAKHGSPTFIAALASVGIRTDGYSTAGRNRAAGIKRQPRRVTVHSHLAGEPCNNGCHPYED